MHAMATISFINHLRNVEDLKQIWYADDASAAGSSWVGSAISSDVDFYFLKEGLGLVQELLLRE